MIARAFRAATVCVATLLIGGCAQRENIPTYPPMSAADSLKTIEDRSAKIQSLSGQGAITLTDSGGNSIRLDAAFAFAPPDRARVRAWKFGQAVLDLTETPDGVWLFLPRGNDSHAQQARDASAQTGRAIRQWLGLLGGKIATDDSTVRFDGDSIVVISPEENPGQKLTRRYEIDRATLTLRRIELRDSTSSPLFTLVLGQYRTIGAGVWPTKIEADSPRGKVAIELRELTTGATAAAFHPPARAERLP